MGAVVGPAQCETTTVTSTTTITIPITITTTTTTITTTIAQVVPVMIPQESMPGEIAGAVKMESADAASSNRLWTVQSVYLPKSASEQCSLFLLAFPAGAIVFAAFFVAKRFRDERRINSVDDVATELLVE